MYDDAVAGKIRLLISEVTITEVCKGVSQKKPKNEVIQKIVEFFENDFIERCPVDDRVSMLAGSIIRDHGTGTCDAMILASAIVFVASQFYTRDGLKESGKKTKLLSLNGKTGITIPIHAPGDYAKSSLFTHKP